MAISQRRLLAFAGIATYAVVFTAFLLFEVPGLGLGHFFYLAIALVALSTGLAAGVIAGLAATALYSVAVLLNPHIPPAELFTSYTGIRLITYTAIGALIGWFASNNRSLVEELSALAERDALTGLPNTRAFETSIDARFARGLPFAILVANIGPLDAAGDRSDALRRLADMLAGTLAPGDDLARVGPEDFAILSSTRTLDEAAQLAARLETVLRLKGFRVTFGWAVYPRDGENALSLYRAADERLYARKLVRDRGGLRAVHS